MTVAHVFKKMKVKSYKGTSGPNAAFIDLVSIGYLSLYIYMVNIGPLFFFFFFFFEDIFLYLES